jgi:hypothetical protein
MGYSDIKRRRGILNGDIGPPRDLKHDLDKAIANKALWGASDGFVSHAVMAILVGQTNDAVGLLPKAKHWMEVAMEQPEESNHFGAASYRLHRHLYGLVRWLNDGVHDAESMDFRVLST